MGAPPKKKSNMILYIVGGCVGLLALSCCGYIGFAYFWAARAVDDANEAIEEAQENAQEATEGGGGGGGGSVCSRAADCCTAYVEAMGGAGAGMNAEQTCAGVRTPGVPDSTCQSTIDGYRTSLTALGRTVPASCQ